MDSKTENTTSGVKIAEGTAFNIPAGTKIESQPRPDKEKMAAIKEAKENVIKSNQIVTKYESTDTGKP